MNQNPNLNPAALQRLERLGGPEFVGKMVGLFLEYAGGKVAEARAAYAANDLDAIARAVHPIKSSAGNVGATRVQDIANELEILARKGDARPVDAALRDLEHAFEAVKPELLQKQNSPESSTTRKESL